MTTPQAETEALLPCPFCGGEPIIKSHRWANDTVKAHYVHCQKCNVNSHGRNTVEKTVAFWNTRAALTPKPLSVAPEDEAHFKALAQCVHDCGDGDTDSQAVREYGYIAIDALRRRFAELRAVQDAGDAMNKALLAWLDENMDAKPDTPESVTLKRLSDIIEPYESVRWPIGGKK